MQDFLEAIGSASFVTNAEEVGNRTLDVRLFTDFRTGSLIERFVALQPPPGIPQASPPRPMIFAVSVSGAYLVCQRVALFCFLCSAAVSGAPRTVPGNLLMTVRGVKSLYQAFRWDGRIG